MFDFTQHPKTKQKKEKGKENSYMHKQNTKLNTQEDRSKSESEPIKIAHAKTFSLFRFRNCPWNPHFLRRKNRDGEINYPSHGNGGACEIELALE